MGDELREDNNGLMNKNEQDAAEMNKENGMGTEDSSRNGYQFWMEQSDLEAGGYRMKKEEIPNDNDFNSSYTLNQGATQGQQSDAAEGFVPKETENPEPRQTENPESRQTEYQEPRQSANPSPDKIKIKKKSSKTGMKWGQFILAAVIFGVVAGGVFQGINLTVDAFKRDFKTKTQLTTAYNEDKEEKETAIATTAVISSAGGRENDVTKVVENTMPSIVSIASTMTQSYNFFGQDFAEDVRGSGSGIIVGKNKDELLVVTNNHVIDQAKTIAVTFIDNEVVEGQVKGAESATDLAVVSIKLSQIKKETLDKIKIAVLGDSENLKVGEKAVAIGNALGYGQSVTVGYISAKNRTVSVDNTSMKLLQTDAAINPGNSGGALLNMNGEVIGINSVKYADTAVEGIGYAIPISEATPIINELMSREKILEEEKGYLGIELEDVTDAENRSYNMPMGVFIKKVIKGGAAEEAGILPGDIITKINGVVVETKEVLKQRVNNYKKGSKITITLMRYENGIYVEKQVTAKLKSVESLGDANAAEVPSDPETNKKEIPLPNEKDGSGSIDDFGDYSDLFDFFNQFN